MTQSDSTPDETFDATASKVMWYSGALPEAALVFVVFSVLLWIISLPFRLLRKALSRRRD